MSVRCPDCGRSVPSFFQHVDVDCMSKEFSDGWDDYRSGVGLFRGMKRYAGDQQTDYIQGWHSADDVAALAKAEGQS